MEVKGFISLLSSCGVFLQDGWSPLCIASRSGYCAVVKTLIEAGANVNHIMKVV